MLKVLGRFATGITLVALGVGVGAGLAAVPLAAGPSGATAPTSVTVNDAVDDDGGSPGACTSDDGACTLRSAINVFDQGTSGITNLTIDLPDPSGLVDGSQAFYNVDSSVGQGDLDVDSPGNTLTLDYTGTGLGPIEANCTAESCTIDTNLFEVDPGTTLDMDGFSLSDGVATESDGGAILDYGTLNLSDSDVFGNSADNGGGIAEEQGGGDDPVPPAPAMTLTGDTIADNTAGDDGDGGGIYTNAGTATLSGGTIGETGATSPLDVSNTAGGNGGGLAAEGGTVTSTAVTYSGNTTDDGEGGGIYLSTGTDPSFSGDTIENNVSEGGGEDGAGIAIETDATNSFTNETIQNNTCENCDGGGVYIDGGTNTFSGGLITDNTAEDYDLGGGGVFIDNGTNSLSGGTISANTAGDVVGGGVSIAGGTNTLTNETIGGPEPADGNQSTEGEEGGGMFLLDGNNTITGGSIDNNVASGNEGEGGGVGIEGGTNTFSGGSVEDNTAPDGGSEGGGFYIDDGTNTLSDETINSNQVDTADDEDGGGQGGGLYDDYGTTTVTGGSIDTNSAYEGAGVYIDADESQTLSFDQVDISDNTASESGAGLWVASTDGNIPITQSTISDNNVTGLVGESPFLGNGGGLLVCTGNDLTLTNDTISSNTANNLGGGYYGTDCDFGGPVQPSVGKARERAHNLTPHAPVEEAEVTAFLFDTINGNAEGDPGGANIQTVDDSTLTLGESIVAGGTTDGGAGPNCDIGGDSSLTSGGYNVIDDSSCGTPGTGDVIGQAAQLGALQNNGGPTNTQLPASSSPAVSLVPSSVCTGTGVTTDQRGDARGQGTNGACTSGAVEVAVAAPPAYNPNGYRMVANEGGIFDFGLNFNGSLANNHLNAPIVGLANAPGPDGYVMAGADGGTFALGGANYYGGLGGQSIPSPIAAIAAPPSETGYWLVAQNGKIYNFGSVPPLPALTLPPGAHIVGMASTTDGQGAWLTDNLGDVYAEGDAQYKGGMGGQHINAPVVGIAAAASGQGYILVGSDGGVYNYGTQGFYGSVPGSLKPGQSLVAPIVGIAVTHSGNGYWEVGADGGLFNYGDAPFLGDIYTAIPGKKLNGPIVGIQHLGSAPV